MDANRILSLIAVSLLATALAPAGHAAVPVATDHVVINEVLYDPVEGNESVEIHNPTAAPVVLDGWTLTDEDYCHDKPNATDPYTFSGVLAPGAYHVVELPNPIGGFSCLNLALSDTIYLRNPSGANVDTVTWGDGSPTAEDGLSLQRDYVRNAEGGFSDEDLGTVTWTAGNTTLGMPNVHAG